MLGSYMSLWLETHSTHVGTHLSDPPPPGGGTQTHRMTFVKWQLAKSESLMKVFSILDSGPIGRHGLEPLLMLEMFAGKLQRSS